MTLEQFRAEHKGHTYYEEDGEAECLSCGQVWDDLQPTPEVDPPTKGSVLPGREKWGSHKEAYKEAVRRGEKSIWPCRRCNKWFMGSSKTHSGVCDDCSPRDGYVVFYDGITGSPLVKT